MAPLTASSTPWLVVLRVYLLVLAGGNFVWEAAHLPLYTIWQTGTWRENVVAVVHCTGGDPLIGTASSTLALVIAGHQAWPARCFGLVATLAMASGLAYTIFSEWLNIVIRESWGYSARLWPLGGVEDRVGQGALKCRGRFRAVAVAP